MSVSSKSIATTAAGDTISTPLDTMASYLAEVHRHDSRTARVLCTLFVLPALTASRNGTPDTAAVLLFRTTGRGGKTAAARVVLGMSVNPLSASATSARQLSTGRSTMPGDRSRCSWTRQIRCSARPGGRRQRAVCCSRSLNGRIPEGIERCRVSRGGKAVRMPIFAPVIMAGMGRAAREALQSRGGRDLMLPAVPKSRVHLRVFATTARCSGSQAISGARSGSARSPRAWRCSRRPTWHQWMDRPRFSAGVIALLNAIASRCWVAV